jgi:hypothetical protein
VRWRMTLGFIAGLRISAHVVLEGDIIILAYISRAKILIGRAPASDFRLFGSDCNVA